MTKFIIKLDPKSIKEVQELISERDKLKTEKAVDRAFLFAQSERIKKLEKLSNDAYDIVEHINKVGGKTSALFHTVVLLWFKNFKELVK